MAQGRCSPAYAAAIRHAAARNPKEIAQRAALAERALGACALCAWECGADRTRGPAARCGCDTASHAYFQGVIWGEEEFLTPTYAVFFAGCNFNCAFCYAGEENRRPDAHLRVDVEAVAEQVRRCSAPPVSFSLIGGEPTVHLHTALRLIAAVPAELPVVWNSNFYFSEFTASLLEGAADVFVADLHFGNDACAERVAGAPRYLEVVGRNLRWAQGAGRLVVRQLVVPGHLRCCTRPALEWLAAELPGAAVHLLTNYDPPDSAAGALGRELSEADAAEALEAARALGLRTIE